MLAFKEFLATSSKNLANWKKFKYIHVVLGNESCDLDSTISSLVYGYFLYETLKIKNNHETMLYPLLNVSKEDFLLRSLACNLLQKLNLNFEQLCYRTDLNLPEIVQYDGCILKTYLVDHHVLCKNDKILHDSVVEIYDHRPLDKSVKWEENVKLRIEQVGSCATIIADEIINQNERVLCPELADLLYNTIVFDSLAVKPENGRAKPLDINIAKKLESKYDLKRDKTAIFNELNYIHTDVSHLKPEQLLKRDLKFVKNVPIPGLPSLAENFLKKEGAESALIELMECNNSSVVVLIGIESNPTVKRDVCLFFKEGARFKDDLLRKFRSDMDDFKFEEVVSDENVYVFRQNNVKMTRKQILPVIDEFFCFE